MSAKWNPCDLTERKILVTSASSGIGRATAIYLSKLGAQVVLNGRDETRLAATLLQMEGEGHVSCPFDLTDEDTLEGLFASAVSDGKKLNGIVHCAGIPYVIPLKMLSQSRLGMVMEANFYSFVALVRQYAKKKYGDGGSIIGISSMLSVRPRAFETGYVASKAALNAAVGSLACELAPEGIRVNGVLAGPIFTEMAQRTMEQLGNAEHVDKLVSNSLLGWGQPEDVAGVCAFLLSDMSRFITGRMIYVDGGSL